MSNVIPFPAAGTTGRRRLRLVPVKSRAIDAVGYDSERRILDIRY